MYVDVFGWLTQARGAGIGTADESLMMATRSAVAST